jgi:CBS domain-containing protein
MTFPANLHRVMHIDAEEKLRAIADQLRKGVRPPRETARTFLLWFGASRRGLNVCHGIRAHLARNGLQTVPDFEYTYIDGTIEFQKATGAKPDDASPTDPTHRIARLNSANKAPVSVKPDSTIQHVVTLMLTHDYSQLPVMTTPREVKGVVTWKSIGSRMALKQECTTAANAMEPAEIVGSNDSLFSAISTIAECDYVLVRGVDQQICGIVTASDLTEQFQKLAEPFLLVGEIENGVRRILSGKFTVQELTEAKAVEDSDRKVEAISDLTLGEYIRLMEAPVYWERLKLEVDRVEFTKRLHVIRDIRNDVMHFDPEGLDDDDLRTLREFAQFLKRLRDAGAA